MARIERLTSLQSKLAPVEAIDRLVDAAVTSGIKVDRVAPDQADFRRGSQAALRLKGAMFTKLEEFPVVASVRADATSSGSMLAINALDELVVGPKVGMNKKYTEAVVDFGTLLFRLAQQSEAR